MTQSNAMFQQLPTVSVPLHGQCSFREQTLTKYTTGRSIVQLESEEHEALGISRAEIPSQNRECFERCKAKEGQAKEDVGRQTRFRHSNASIPALYPNPAKLTHLCHRFPRDTSQRGAQTTASERCLRSQEAPQCAESQLHMEESIEEIKFAEANLCGCLSSQHEAS